MSGDENVGGEKKKRKTGTKKSKKKKEDVETESDVPSRGDETGEEEGEGEGEGGGEDEVEKRKRETLALLKARSKVRLCFMSMFCSWFPLLRQCSFQFDHKQHWETMADDQKKKATKVVEDDSKANKLYVLLNLSLE